MMLGSNINITHDRVLHKMLGSNINITHDIESIAHDVG